MYFLEIPTHVRPHTRAQTATEPPVSFIAATTAFSRSYCAPIAHGTLPQPITKSPYAPTASSTDQAKNAVLLLLPPTPQRLPAVAATAKSPNPADVILFEVAPTAVANAPNCDAHGACICVTHRNKWWLATTPFFHTGQPSTRNILSRLAIEYPRWLSGVFAEVCVVPR